MNIYICTKLIGKTEHKLEAVLFCVGIPMGPIPVTSIVCLVFNFTSRNAECDGLVWFCGNLGQISMRKE